MKNKIINHTLENQDLKMLGRYIHPQLVDDLSVGLCARFNIKVEPKDVAKYINNFGYEVEKGADVIMSGFPIGKIDSQEQFAEIQKTSVKTDKYFNVQSGRWMNSGNSKMVYGDGWCAKRNSPEHQAMLKIIEQTDDSDDISLDVDEKDGWLVIYIFEGEKERIYIFSKQKEKIIGFLRDGEPNPLTHKTIKHIKESNYPFERLEYDEILKHKLSY